MAERENWISTDEAEDVAASVRHALRCNQLVVDDPHAWKWLFLALHAALQGACVCHLDTTASPVGVVTDKNAAVWIEYFEESRTNPNTKSPKTYLLSLPELLEKVRMPHSAGDGSAANGIQVSDQELDWMRRLHNNIRNQFVHFAPKGWSIEVSGFRDSAKLISRIVEEILDNGWAFRHKTAKWKHALRRDLKELSSL